jgi:ketosteroid isomerase-like protein
MLRLIRSGCFMLIVLLCGSPLLADDDRKADHEALQAMLKIGTEALNSGNFDALIPVLHKEFTAITVDNQKFTTIEAFREHWNGLFKGDKRALDRIVTQPVADDRTRFLRDDVGLVHGVSNDTYHFRDGEVRTMMVRWTAVVAKENDVWKLVKLHMSANLLDNPVVDALKQALVRTATMASIACLLLGLAIGFLLGKRRR